MANIWHIASVILFSLLLLAVLGWFVYARDNRPSETLLPAAETLTAPLSLEELKITDPGMTNESNRVAVLKTNRGTVTIELFEDVMPITTGNFIKLAEEGFYDETKFHRVIDGFMIQGGDPNSKGNDTSSYGSGGPGYTIPDEFVADAKLSNTRGTISMANTGQPNSGGSQFFINTVNNTPLDFDKEPFTSRHPVFGRVVGGMEIVDAISRVDTQAGDVPIDPVILESVQIVSQE